MAATDMYNDDHNLLRDAGIWQNAKVQQDHAVVRAAIINAPYNDRSYHRSLSLPVDLSISRPDRSEKKDVPTKIRSKSHKLLLGLSGIVGGLLTLAALVHQIPGSVSYPLSYSALFLVLFASGVGLLIEDRSTKRK